MTKALWIALALLAAAGAARADPLPQFLQETIRTDLSQIMLGQLAGRRGGSAGVRAFGRDLAVDHTGIELRAIALAGSMGVEAPNQASEEGRQAYAKLQGLEGQDFDRAFLGGAIAELHEEIAGFKTLAAGEPGPATQFAKDAVAALEKRLEAAEALQGGG